MVGPMGPIDLPNKKLAGLLAYLSCSGAGPQRREKLATLLWGSHFEIQARQNLRQGIFRLREVLGQDSIVGDGAAVRLASGLVNCDATRFEALSRSDRPDALLEAINTYKGTFLADVTVREQAFSDWLIPEQKRLEDLALGVLVGHSELELRLGNNAAALKSAEQALQLHALREDAHRLVIRALVASHRRADALMHYQELVTLLKRELNVHPDPETCSLVASLRLRAVVDEAQPDRNAVAHSGRVAIAVLPLTNMSGDTDLECFANGLVEDILSALSCIRGLGVLARKSSFSYRDCSVGVKQIGRELGARYVLDGSLRRVAKRVRVAVQLIDAETQTHIWADRYDRELGEILALQDEITHRIVSSIKHSVQVVDKVRREFLLRSADCAGQNFG